MKQTNIYQFRNHKSKWKGGKDMFEGTEKEIGKPLKDPHTHLSWWKHKDKCFKNALNDLYETHFIPLSIPTPLVPRVNGGVGKGGHNGGKQFCIKMHFRQLKIVFFFQWKTGSKRTHPPYLNGKFRSFFFLLIFLTVPNFTNPQILR